MEISEVKKGMHVVIDGDLYQVIDFLHVKPGKGAAFMSTKIKNVRTGTTLERNFNTNYKVDEARINRTNVQYLYNDGSTYYFMDNNTYDQVEIPAERIGDDKYYLIENNSDIPMNFTIRDKYSSPKGTQPSVIHLASNYQIDKVLNELDMGYNQSDIIDGEFIEFDDKNNEDD